MSRILHLNTIWPYETVWKGVSTTAAGGPSDFWNLPPGGERFAPLEASFEREEKAAKHSPFTNLWESRCLDIYENQRGSTTTIYNHSRVLMMTSKCHMNGVKWFLMWSISHDFLPGPEVAIKHFFFTSGTILWYGTKFIQFLETMVRRFWNLNSKSHTYSSWKCNNNNNKNKKTKTKKTRLL